MYLLPIHVPVYLDGERVFVTTEWKRSLVLLRDSLKGKLGPIVVMAPSLPASGAAAQSLEEMNATSGIEVRGGLDGRCRARQYWLHERTRWRHNLREAMRTARVVHGGLDDVFRPIAFDGCLEAIAQGKPLVFVRDVDQVRQMRELAAGKGAVAKARAVAYGFAFDRCMRRGVQAAILTMLKGRSLCDRYRPYANNPHEFEDTSYTSNEIVSRELVDRRLSTLDSGRPLRFVYCGRIEGRKGVDHSIRAVAEAAKLGALVEFDIIGGGTARAECEKLLMQLGASQRVRFLGRKPYGPALLRELAAYDALLFTPIAEDTPRMIFDAYAAGLPMVAYGIEYVKERAEKEGATVLLTPGEPEKAGALLAELARDRSKLRQLTEQAARAAAYHAADVWYARRAQWTFEALDRFESQREKR
jgi:glycosyltransferase involved in cell wall biosynthesis